MPNGFAKTNFFVFSVVVITAIAFLSLGAVAEKKPQVQTGVVFDTYINFSDSKHQSPVFTTDFDFNIAGLAWQGSGTFSAELRWFNKAGWSEWFGLESSDRTQKEGWSYSIEPVIADAGSKLQYRLRGEGDIEQVKVIYLDTVGKSIKPNFNLFNLLFNKVSADSDIITRTGWGADEDWRYVGDQEVWPAEYQWPEKIVIHHTAGNDGGDNPEATIRGVYYWHAVVLGWGDIGYNYLIDQQGNIYEGRQGGEGVIGAHVYRSATCARERFGGEEFEANFNKGTIGIAILGDYENRLTLNSKVKNALVSLIAEFGTEFDIEPSGEGFMIDDVYPNVVGHRDLDCTACPGRNLRQEIPSIRTDAQSKYEELGGIIDMAVKATYIDQSEQPININVGEIKEVWVDFRNNGDTTWRSYTASPVQVVAKNKDSLFNVASGDSGSQIAQLITPNVGPGEVGRFVFFIQGPEDALSIEEKFQLRFGNELVSGTTFTVTAKVTGLIYAAELDNQKISPATFVNSKEEVTLQFKNRGINTWEQDDIRLKIYDLDGQQSRYYDKSWPSHNGDFNFVEQSVAPNEMATFKLIFKSPSEPGLYYNIYELDGIDELVQEQDRSITRVDSLYQAELSGFSMPPAVLSGWRPEVTFSFRNTGTSTWDRSFGLQILDLGGEVSKFVDSSWDDIRIATHLNELRVSSGETATFTMKVRPPSKPGIYLNTFRMFKDGQPVLGSDFSMITRVDE